MLSTAASPASSARRQRLAHGLLAVYWLTIFTLTHWPRLAPPPIVPHTDKWAHGLVYALLAWLYFSARSTIRPLLFRDYLTGMLIFVTYGIADELLQIPVGRSCELYDWVADVFGALLGTLAFWLFSKTRHRRTN